MGPPPVCWCPKAHSPFPISIIIGFFFAGPILEFLPEHLAPATFTPFGMKVTALRIGFGDFQDSWPGGIVIFLLGHGDVNVPGLSPRGVGSRAICFPRSLDIVDKGATLSARRWFHTLKLQVTRMAFPATFPKNTLTSPSPPVPKFVFSDYLNE